MIKVHYPPEKPISPLGVKVFLAGTIDMGNSRNWQEEVIHYLQSIHTSASFVHVFNPRRPDWDDSWEQSDSNYHFRKQVEWELDRLEEADIIVMALMEDSKSPISLLELGAFKHKRMIVYCPDGFYRKGNVDIFCRRQGIKAYSEWDTFLSTMKLYIGRAEW